MTRSRQRTFVFLAILIGTALSVVFLEAGLRLLAPAWLDQRMEELSAGESFEPGSDQKWPAMREDNTFRQFAPEATFVARHFEYEHEITIDELGGRITPYPPDHEGLLPFLGDSFTFGLGVDDSETFMSLIAPWVSRRVLNLGVPGSGLHDQLSILAMRHRSLASPELYVFVMFMGNDLTDIRKRHEAAAAVDSGTKMDDGQGWLWQANEYVVRHGILRRIYAIQFLRQKALLLTNRAPGGYMEPVFSLMREDSPDLEKSLDHLRKELGRLARLSRALSFDYVFILIPDVHQLDETRRAGKAESLGLSLDQLDPEGLSSAIRDTLDDSQVSYTDLSPCLAASMTNGLFYVQDDHFTVEGHALAAECIRRSGLLARLHVD